MRSLTALPEIEIDSLTFSAPAANIYGFLSPDLAMLFKGGRLLAYSDSTVTVEQTDPQSWRAAMTAMQGSFELVFTIVSEIGSTSSGPEYVCRVSGIVSESGQSEANVECLGTLSGRIDSAGPPKIRSAGIVFDEQNALTANAYRPAIYHGHGDERVEAVLLEAGQSTTAKEARISTIYGEQDIQSQASIELWLPDDELPRRLTGDIVKGTHAQVSEWLVNTGFFEWRLGSLVGHGLYEVAATRPAPLAA